MQSIFVGEITRDRAYQNYFLEIFGLTNGEILKRERDLQA